jgi:hypothetical protein
MAIVISLLVIALCARYRPRGGHALRGDRHAQLSPRGRSCRCPSGRPRLSRDDRRVGRADWRMAPVDSLPPAAHSRVRVAGMIALRLYLIVAVGLLAVKTVQLALGTH